MHGFITEKEKMEMFQWALEDSAREQGKDMCQEDLLPVQAVRHQESPLTS